MALGSTQPLTEISTRKDSWGGGKALPPSVSRLSRRCGSLDLSHPYGPSRPLTGIALLFFFYFIKNIRKHCGGEEKNCFKILRAYTFLAPMSMKL
jgi:hypothetical protein